MARGSASDARDAVLCGFRGEARFDESGREDARNLIWPFISSTDVVLDVGCGAGRLLKWAATRSKRVIGLDVSAEMLKRVRERIGKMRKVSLRKLPLSLRFPVRSSEVDFAYFYHVSEHIEREDALLLIKEIRRCLKPRGRALIQFSMIDHPDNQREFLTWARDGDEEGVRSRFYTDSEVIVMLKMARFHPQIRLFIPGEYVVVVTKTDKRVLGEMPLVSLNGPCSCPYTENR